MADEVLTSRTGSVLTITLNRPDVYNAINRALHEGLADALREAADPEIRAVVLTGAGRGFCSGQDLREFQSLPGGVREALEQTYHPNVRALRALEKPVVAAVNGPVAGAGISLACACDVRIGSSAATFVPGFIGIGLVPDAGSTWFLHRLLGFSRAFEWMVSNRRLSADEALAWGLLSEVVPEEEFPARVEELALVVRRAADEGRRDDEAAVRARVCRVTRHAARARGRAPAGRDGDRRLHGGRAGVPREAPGELHGTLTTPVRVTAVDYHTAGEPFRIVTGGVDAPQGETILDKRRDAHERLDGVRRLLVHEPRGHADMYGCFVVEPNDDDADLGVVFFHNAGYSTACGHGTIALVTWALDEGIVAREEGETHVVVDVPSGRLDAWARVRDGRVVSVRFRNVPAFVWAEGVELGDRSVDVAFGGAFYASRRGARRARGAAAAHRARAAAQA